MRVTFFKGSNGSIASFSSGELGYSDQCFAENKIKNIYAETSLNTFFFRTIKI